MARAKLDAAGLTSAKIIASSGLDEHAIAALVAQHAPIDSYGVGENITEPVDAPITGVIYNLVQNHTAGISVCKRSSGGKSTRPCVKQAWRLADHDLVGLADEEAPEGGEALLAPLMTAGRPHPPAARVVGARALHSRHRPVARALAADLGRPAHRGSRALARRVLRQTGSGDRACPSRCGGVRRRAT